ncbi:hypothetical protein MNEG_2067 [Monoraphidium neglectum]|uniref:GH16 domain-containing protein n=1 Tax=Monoraphidium neglectum TaxID=145388 RepID=A0A0D2K6A1_9CHLO|nr:hypothetical protein MNEG_2067 [Monoraphidium neglectum]KIZ05888.1 hypothetical protein MNEG_2067 [Monoraphidium neglectum]|eukprot:XP_013904907.1 hypothetical protein MNEG_2067 [Monoraphidium neglectum]
MLLLTIVVLLVATPASAATARYDATKARAAQGAYLGCFNASALTMDLSGAAALAPATAAKCLPFCRWRRMPLYTVTPAFRCACGAAVPSPSALLPDDACEAAVPTGVEGAVAVALPVFYTHSLANEQCSVRRMSLDWDTFEAAYGAENALFDGSGDTLVLRMRGADGVRVAARQSQLFGMFSFKARISEMPGVITAAYVSKLPGQGARIVEK